MKWELKLLDPYTGNAAKWKSVNRSIGRSVNPFATEIKHS